MTLQGSDCKIQSEEYEIKLFKMLFFKTVVLRANESLIVKIPILVSLQAPWQEGLEEEEEDEDCNCPS